MSTTRRTTLFLLPVAIAWWGACHSPPPPPPPDPDAGFDGGVIDCRADGGSEADGGFVPTCGARVQGASCAPRPYGPNAPWNVPACNLRQHPQSADFARRLFLFARKNITVPPEDNPDVQALAQFTTLFGVNSAAGNDFSTASYSTTDPVNGAQTEKWVFRREDFPGRFNHGPRASGTHCAPFYAGGACDSNTGGADDEKIPFNDDWRPPDGSDGHTVVRDPPTGREFYVWAWTGSWSSQHTCGVFPRNGSPWTSPTSGAAANPVFSGPRDLCAGSYQLLKSPVLGATDTSTVSYWTWEGNAPYITGGGMPIGSSLAEPEEVAAGEVRHALKMTIFNTLPGPRCDDVQRASGTDLGVTCGDAVSPAGNFEKDGSSSTPEELSQGVPEGMRFALRVTDAEIETWLDSRSDLNCGDSCARRRETARVLAVALRDYGWFISMSSGYAGAFLLSGGANPQKKAAWQSLGITGPDTGFLRGLITLDRLWVVDVPQAQCVAGAKTPTTTWWCEDDRGKGVGASTFTY